MSAPPEDNQSDFVTHPHIVLDQSGELLQCIVKASFEWSPEERKLFLLPRDKQRPLRFADVPWGEPEISSIAFPADTAVRKPHTDIVVVACAYPPAGPEVPWFDAYARVGPVQKAIRVFGLRVWQAGGAGLSSPRPAKAVEVRYENAWGGSDSSDPARYLEEPRNPVGRGVARDARSLTHQIAPCIEDPANPIQNASTWPKPAGLSAIGRHFQPRRSFGGTYDEAWKTYRAPLPPDDQDDRVYQMAHPDLVATSPLRGDEACAFLNLTKENLLEFSLPGVAVEIEFQVDGRAPARFRPPLDTALFDLYGPNPPTVELVWRASVKAPRKLEQSLTIVREVPVS